MRSHILRAISEGDLDPKKAHVASKGKLVQKKPSTSQTTEVKDEEVVTGVSVDMPAEEIQQLTEQSSTVESVSEQISNHESIVVETVQEPVVEKKKSTFFKKKSLTSA